MVKWGARIKSQEKTDFFSSQNDSLRPWLSSVGLGLVPARTLADRNNKKPQKIRNHSTFSKLMWFLNSRGFLLLLWTTVLAWKNPRPAEESHGHKLSIYFGKSSVFEPSCFYPCFQPFSIRSVQTKLRQFDDGRLFTASCGIRTK